MRSPRAYLTSVVTRLCIDQRRAIEARKETYVGPWLPEPIVEDGGPPSASQRAEVAESVSLAFLVALETLTPLERAAYLLRQTFDFEYDEIAAILDKSADNCRQLVSRAQAHLRAGRPRFEAKPDEAERLTTAFLEACATRRTRSPGGVCWRPTRCSIPTAAVRCRRHWPRFAAPTE